jgi:hypothetical protein
MPQDSYGRSFPLAISVSEREPASRDKLQAFQAMTNEAFAAVARAIGDIDNARNAAGSALAANPLYITSLGRAIGSMADVVPPLGGLETTSPALSAKLADMTYNVIPHPDQADRLEVGCRHDMTPSSDAAARRCAKGRDGFYCSAKGERSGICRATDCPDWSGRDWRLLPGGTGVAQTFREYKLVVPNESRTVERIDVVAYSDCGSAYDRYRTDEGGAGFRGNSTLGANSWAQASGAGAVSYEYRNLGKLAAHVVVVEVPAVPVEMLVSVNGVAQGTIVSDGAEIRRYVYALDAGSGYGTVKVRLAPATQALLAAVSQIWVLERTSAPHPNSGKLLRLPKILDGLSYGAEIPANFLQLFDTDPAVNRVLDGVRTFASRFNPGVVGDAFDVRLVGGASLEAGGDRYLAVTTGTPIAPLLGALLDAFVEHVNDVDVHMDRSAVCSLIGNRTACCEGRIRPELVRTVPATRRAVGFPVDYSLFVRIAGGNPPYTVHVDWGDGEDRPAASGVPACVSGLQAFALSAAACYAAQGVEFAHEYRKGGAFDVRFYVMDDPARLACDAELANVGPFVVGNPPVVLPEVRLDYATAYPSYVYRPVGQDYAFNSTPAAQWTAKPVYHVLTQVHDSDAEDGKPRQFQWGFANDNGLVFQFYRESVSGVQESASFSGGVAQLAHPFVQHDSLSLRKNGRIYAQGSDYTVDWAAGRVYAVGSSIGDAEGGFAASYMAYSGVSGVAGVANAWIPIGGPVSTASINVHDLAGRADMNTIRFKVSDDDPADLV